MMFTRIFQQQHFNRSQQNNATTKHVAVLQNQSQLLPTTSSSSSPSKNQNNEQQHSTVAVSGISSGAASQSMLMLTVNNNNNQPQPPTSESSQALGNNLNCMNQNCFQNNNNNICNDDKECQQGGMRMNHPQMCFQGQSHEFLGHCEGVEGNCDAVEQHRGKLTMENVAAADNLVNLALQRGVSKKLSPEDFVLLKVIGKGSYGNIWNCLINGNS